MLVRNLVAWGGHDFNLLPGELVELPDATARDRVAAGLAEFPTDAAPTAKRGPGRPRKDS